MAAEKPPAIGQPSDMKYISITETAELPEKRKDVVSAVQRILEIGLVQKLIVEVGKPIQFTRLVPENLITEEQKPVDEDPLDAVRAGEVVEFKGSSTYQPMETLFHAFNKLSSEHYEPKLIVVGGYSALRKWLKLGLKNDLTTIFGIRTRRSASMPEDALMLAGVNPADPERIVYSLRVAMEE